LFIYATYEAALEKLDSVRKQTNVNNFEGAITPGYKPQNTKDIKIYQVFFSEIHNQEKDLIKKRKIERLARFLFDDSIPCRDCNGKSQCCRLEQAKVAFNAVEKMRID
jgi:hypothetical protein